MVCKNKLEIPGPEHSTFVDLAFIASTRHNWAYSQGAHGAFLCCEDCYPKAFTLEFGGSVGKLREEYKKYSTKVAQAK